MIEKLDHRLARLRFRDLQVLIAIAERGSLRRAAQIVGISQPALSKALREIEDAFGAALFIRRRSGLVATPFGTRIISGAEVLLTELKSIQTSARASREPPLRLGCTHFLAKVVLPRWLKNLGNREAQVREGTLPELLVELSRGRIDAVLALYPDSDNTNDAYTHRLLFKETLQIVASSAMPVGNSWSDLSKAAWILPPPNSVVRRVIELRFLAEGLVPPMPAIESMHMSTNLKLVTDGLGVAAISQRYLSGERASKGFRIIKVKPLPEVPVSLVLRKGAERHHRTRVASQMLSKEFFKRGS
jgi:LysR family transcriptional regulator, regulator of abg operon